MTFSNVLPYINIASELLLNYGWYISGFWSPAGSHMWGSCRNWCNLGISETKQSKLCITFMHSSTYRPPLYTAFCPAAEGRCLGETQLQSWSHQPNRHITCLEWLSQEATANQHPITPINAGERYFPPTVCRQPWFKGTGCRVKVLCITRWCWWRAEGTAPGGGGVAGCPSWARRQRWLALSHVSG